MIEIIVNAVLLLANIPFALGGSGINIFACGFVSAMLIRAIISEINDGPVFSK